MKVDGRKIKQLRDARGCSQAVLADRAGIGQKVVWNMENGVGGHLPNTVLRVAEALDTTVEELTIDTLPDTGEEPSRLALPNGNRIEIWRQDIYDGEPGSGGIVEKTDEVLLERLGEYEIRATIRRKDSSTGEEWEFLGRKAEGMIFGHYWRTNGQGSSGVLLLRETGPHADLYRGFYTKIRRDILSSDVDTLSISHITLDWTLEGVRN